jgi:isoleucyl-tRNA synthetase
MVVYIHAFSNVFNQIVVLGQNPSVQQMRKNNGYEMMDRIKIFYTSSPEIDKAVKDFQDYIKEETLADAIIVSNEEGMEVQNLNGIDTGMKLEKVNR